MATLPQTNLLPPSSKNDSTLAPGAEARIRPLPANGATKTWKVRALIGAESSQTVNLEISGQVSVGRADVIDGFTPGLDLGPFGAQDAGVSRRHAMIHPQDNALYVRDLGSTNGTFLNGFSLSRNTSYKLTDGDEIEFGQLRVRVYIVHPPG